MYVACLDYAAIITIQHLAELGQLNVSITYTLGVSDGSVGYHPYILDVGYVFDNACRLG